MDSVFPMFKKKNIGLSILILKIFTWIILMIKKIVIYANIFFSIKMLKAWLYSIKIYLPAFWINNKINKEKKHCRHPTPNMVRWFVRTILKSLSFDQICLNIRNPSFVEVIIVRDLNRSHETNWHDIDLYNTLLSVGHSTQHQAWSFPKSI